MSKQLNGLRCRMVMLSIVTTICTLIVCDIIYNIRTKAISTSYESIKGEHTE